MRFPGIRLVEQTKQKFRRFESVLKKNKKKKTSDCKSRALLLIKAPTLNICNSVKMKTSPIKS